MTGSCYIFLHSGKITLAISPFDQIYKKLNTNLKTDWPTVDTTGPVFPKEHTLNQQKRITGISKKFGDILRLAWVFIKEFALRQITSSCQIISTW